MAEREYSYQDSRRKKLVTFIWLNVISVGAMLAIFFGVLYGDFLTGAFATSWRWLSRHKVVMVLAASTPFFAALLVGRASAAKAKRKRLAEARRRAEEELAEEKKRRALRGPTSSA